MSIEHHTPSSYCKWVIAKDYYDGPVSGIGLLARSNGEVFFRVVGWDPEQWDRVFAITTASREAVEVLRSCLTRIEPAREPFWLPGRETNTPEAIAAWRDLLSSALSAPEWTLVESHDLQEAINERRVFGAEARRVAEMVRREEILELRSAAILDELVRRVQHGR